MEGFTFHRSDLATFYWEGLQAHGIRNFRSGLFLTAPRRTGKSTFLREDFIPHIQKNGGLPVIVDLWEKPDVDMVTLLTEALVRELDLHAGFLSRAAKKTGMSKINLTGRHDAAEFNTTQQESAENSLMILVTKLRVKSGKPVALIIDEAQHALQTEAGRNGMFALKAARDALNLGSKETGLFLVFTGSNRDKLAELVTRKSQPFFGSAIEKFPLLDNNFVSSYAEHMKRVSGVKDFDVPILVRAFDWLGKKPDTFFRVVNEAITANSQDKNGALMILAKKEVELSVKETHARVAALPETQRIVLETLLNAGRDFAPFSADTLAKYESRKDGRRMTVPAIQKALDALREKGFLWRGSYGDYAIDDDALLDWHKTSRSQHTRS